MLFNVRPVRAWSLRVLAALALMILAPLQAAAMEAHIAVAANFMTTAKALAADFEQRTGYKVKLSFGSTGKLYAQIYHGAPYEAFLAADVVRPEKAEQEGLAVAGTRFTYAKGKLALWSLKEAPLDRLKQGDFRRLAIANPRTAPYGAAAKEVMNNWGVEAPRGKVVKGENIAQTYQFVATGNADIGFVALSQLPLRDGGYHWVIPETDYQPIEQQAVLLKKGEQSEVAKAFLAYLVQNDAQKIIEQSGYGLDRATDPG